MRARNSSKKVSEHDPGKRYKQATKKHFLEEPTEMMVCSKVSKYGESTIFTGTPVIRVWAEDLAWPHAQGGF